MEKTCSKCGEKKPATTEYFHREGRKEYGLRSKCKQCRSEEHQNPTGPTLTCKYCGKEYIPKSKERKTYCRPECYRLDVKSKRKCIACDKPLIDKGKWLNYCSDECKPKQYYICAVCGKKEEGCVSTKYCCECKKEIARVKQRERSAKEHNPKTFMCRECGKDFSPEYGDRRRVYCSDDCASVAANKKEKKTDKYKDRKRRERQRRRARKYGGPIEIFNDSEIFERANWVCGICGKRVDKNKKYPHPRSPSLDHIIPFARGGHHTRENVQLSHLICNSIKRDNMFIPRDDGQLMIV